MRTYNVNGNDITATQWALLNQINSMQHSAKKHDSVQLNGNPIFLRQYNDNEAALFHDITALAGMGLIKVLKQDAKHRVTWTEAGATSFSPSNEPITPGVRRPAVTNGTCAEQHIPATITDALTTLGSTPLYVNQDMAAFMGSLDGRFHKDWLREHKAAMKGLLSWGDDALYSDTYIDWRGRTYCQSGTFGSFTQGGTQRAMLDAEPVSVEVGSKEYNYFLTIIEAEYNVTEENYEEILMTSAQEIRGGKHLQRFRAAFAIQEIKETGQTGYMIEQDASCSGGQIIALLTGDAKLAKYTNLLPDSVKHDLYTFISDDAQVQDLLLAKGIRSKALIRSAAKPVVMLSFYGASADSIALNIWEENDGEMSEVDEWVDDSVAVPIGTITWLNKEWTMPELHALVTIMSERLKNQFPSFKGFSGAMQSWYAKSTNNDESRFTTMEWVTGNGHLISRVIDVDKKGGTMPNFVHSVDASIVHRVINECARQGITIMTVHDAFFTTIDKALVLKQIIAQCYAEVIEATEDPTGRNVFTPCSTMLKGLKDAALVGEITYA